MSFRNRLTNQRQSFRTSQLRFIAKCRWPCPCSRSPDDASSDTVNLYKPRRRLQTGRARSLSVRRRHARGIPRGILVGRSPRHGTRPLRPRHPVVWNKVEDGFQQRLAHHSWHGGDKIGDLWFHVGRPAGSHLPCRAAWSFGPGYRNGESIGPTG